MPQLQLDRRHFLAGLGAGSALLAGGAPVRALAQLAEPTAWPSTEAFLSAYRMTKPLPGAMAAIGHGMEPTTYLAAGQSAFVGGAALGPDTIWRIYSMTKPVTGMAAMILVDDGALTLDQDIGELLPEWASPMVLADPANSLDARPAAGPITVRHLLTHTAGLGYSIVPPLRLQAAIMEAGLFGGQISRDPAVNAASAGGATVGAPPTSIEEFSQRAASLPLLADPGAVWSYSMSLEILARVIEVAAGIPYEDFLRTRMFEPLGMADTFFQVPASKIGQMTDNHALVNGNVVVIDPADSVYLDPPPIAYGGGGLASSAHDYDRFLMMLLGHGAIGDARIMSEETARLGMSDLLPADVDKSRMYAPSGFGAGGAVATGVATGGTEGQPAGSFGWGGAAGTAAWVDFRNNMRVSAYIQLIGQPNNDFRPGFTNAVYADTAAQRADG
ncbi:MAG: beta-lactamase family protein [Sphingomonadaceae bacterium]|nr:beta-lactamase family protein [Sphingomonadaceae bacterium]